MSQIDNLANLPGLAVLILGRIVRSSPDDMPMVDYPGNPAGPLLARIATEMPSAPIETWPPVLLAFENGDPRLPIIIGFVRKKINRERRRVPKLVFEAEDEVLLQCGKSSVLLRRDGKIIIKGGDIVSRASGSNKVRGATVRLN